MRACGVGGGPFPNPARGWENLNKSTRQRREGGQQPPRTTPKQGETRCGPDRRTGEGFVVVLGFTAFFRGWTAHDRQTGGLTELGRITELLRVTSSVRIPGAATGWRRAILTTTSPQTMTRQYSAATMTSRTLMLPPLAGWPSPSLWCGATCAAIGSNRARRQITVGGLQLRAGVHAGSTGNYDKTPSGTHTSGRPPIQGTRSRSKLGSRRADRRWAGRGDGGFVAQAVDPYAAPAGGRQGANQVVDSCARAISFHPRTHGANGLTFAGPSVDGPLPVKLPTHRHGQGYSDLKKKQLFFG